MYRWLLVFLALTQTTSIASAQTNGRLPLETFYQEPVLSHIQLSPDGTHLAAVKNTEGLTTVITLNLSTGDIFYPIKTNNTQYKFNWVAWANNDRLLMSVRFDTTRGSLTKVAETRLLSADAKQPGKVISLIKPSNQAKGWISQFQDNVISLLPDDPKSILVSVDRDAPGLDSVYKVDIYTGKLKRIQKPVASVRSWIADRQGKVRIGAAFNDDERSSSIKMLDPSTNEWAVVWQYKIFEEPGISALGFGTKPDELYLSADHEGRSAIYKVDLAQPGYPRTLMLSDPNYDVSGSLIYAPSVKEVVGIYYSDDSYKSIFWNKEFKDLQTAIDKTMPDTSNFIISLSDDARKYLIFSSNPTQPGSILLGDRDKRSLAHVADLYPGLNEQTLTGKQLLSYKARDGLILEGYLSLPRGSRGKPLATIILPHGGPMSQDSADFDAFSAFMVNRGYAVFQPNFRGSSGYGHNFMMMGVGNMGLSMQDDLEDAVHFLVAEKIADPKRVGIVGGSYGGYAALMGATKTPDLFRCAISIAGISDIVKLREEARYYLNKNVIREQLGNDKAQLRESSPRLLVENVKIPILLIHGDDDTIVPVEQSRLMARALQKNGKEHEYVELEGGTHYLDYLPHRKQTFELMENFLQKYLPVDTTSAPLSSR